MSNDTFESKVNEVVGQVTRNDEGKLVMPEGLDEATAFAVRTEIRRRDTQSALTKEQQATRRLTAERDQFAEHWQQDFTKNFTAAQQTELEELKTTDPDAWRTRLQELENEAATKYSEKSEEISKKATYASEEERRTAVFEAFTEANPDVQLTDDVIENDIPPRITKQLENGDITFEDFLDKCKDYLTKGKVVADNPAPNNPNINAAPGGSTPGAADYEKAAAESYNKEIF